MMLNIAFYAFLALVNLTLAFDELDNKTIKRIKKDLYHLFEADGFADIPKVNRLVFHDCAGDLSCNGCINLSNGNDQLLDVVGKLETLYNAKFAKVLSRADFWQLAGVVVLEAAVDLNNAASAQFPSIPFTPELKLKLKFGRVDCATSPDTSVVQTVPVTEMSTSEMFQWFEDNLGFNKREVTALMGAHTLGSSNSVGGGMFVTNESLFFNNKFYSQLVDNKLTFINSARIPESTTNKKFKFELFDEQGDKVAFRFNTDIEIAYDIDVNKINGTSCTINGNTCTRCPESKTISWVKKYAKNAALWIKHFDKVYKKVTEVGF